MRILSLVLVVVCAVSLDNHVSTAFQSSQWRPSRRRGSSNNGSISTELSVASKPPRGSGKEEKKARNGWDDLKRAIYSGVDSVGDISSKISGGGEKSPNGVSDGYSSFEQSIKKKGPAPGSKLMQEYEARASALGIDKAISSSPVSKEKSRTSFDSFKENLYSASDAFGSLSAEPATPLKRLERNIPYKESLAQELGVASEKVEDLLSDNPVKRFQAQQEIREREARQRAEARNERIRAKKEDLYKIVDAMQAAVDTFPDTIEKTEESIKKTIEGVKGVPKKVEKVVEEVKSIPLSVKAKAEQTKQTVEVAIEKTKKVVDDVVDIPNKVTRKVKDTAQAAVDTTESIKDGVTNVRVFLRLEKPKPKPPKMPPPKTKTARDIALQVAGSAASGAGKVTWWATKSVASAAWNGAQSAIEKRQNGPAKTPKPPSIPPPSRPSKLDQQTAELQKEIDEALRLAEETLRKTEE